MKKVLALIFVLFAMVTPKIFSQQQKEPEVVREIVFVSNVEVPVRVFFKGKLVDNLKKSDFKIYEGRKLQEINGFYLKRKQIKTQDVNFASGKVRESEEPRYFVLVFRVMEYTKELKKGIDYLFDNMLNEQDQLLIFVNEKTIFLRKSFWEIKRRDILDQVLREESVKAWQRLSSYFIRIKQDLENTKMKIAEQVRQSGQRAVGNLQRPDDLINFLKKYLTSWREYKYKYLIPDMDKYYNFSQHLDGVNLEKWIINFYQIEMFPKMKVTGRLHKQIEQIVNEMMTSRSEDVAYSQIINSLLDDINRELNVAADFPAEEISKLFYKVNATFHSIFMGLSKETLNEDLEYKRISTDIENSLRAITEKTGGELVVSNDLGSALHSISKKEDVSYVLTYSPNDPDKVGKIKVEVNNKEYDVYFNKNMRADYINEYLERKKAGNPTIRLSEVEFKDRSLFLTINDFLRREVNRKITGRINVRVQVKNFDNRKLFDQNRGITAKKDLVNINMDFKWMKKGKYNIIIDVTDLLTGKTTMEFIQTEVK